jgi:hypothetical protein
MNKLKCLLKNEGQESKTNPVWGWYQWEGGGHKERVKKGHVVEDLCIHV